MVIELDMEDFRAKFDIALKGIALDLQESLKSKLTKEHGKDTGLLQGGIIGSSNGNVVTITMPVTGKYIEWGTPPHMPPVDALKGWSRRKLGDENLAWAVAYSIKKRGTRPYPFIRPTFKNDLKGIIHDNFKDAFT